MENQMFGDSFAPTAGILKASPALMRIHECGIAGAESHPLIDLYPFWVGDKKGGWDHRGAPIAERSVPVFCLLPAFFGTVEFSFVITKYLASFLADLRFLP